MAIDLALYTKFHEGTRRVQRIPQATDFDMVNHLPLYARHLGPGDRVLDIGCGGGSFGVWAASRGAIVTALDVVPDLIREVAQAAALLNLPGLAFDCRDFMTIEAEGAYDVVMLTEVLEHLPDDRAALVQIHRLLALNGRLLLSVPSIHAPLHRRALRRLGRDPFDERVGHLRRYAPASLFNLLHETGFALSEFRLCEGLLRNWLYNDPVGQVFMRLNRSFVRRLVTWLDDRLFTPAWGESDIIVACRKR